jgi:hypothetical protein
VILGDKRDDATTADIGRLPTLDELFRSAVTRTPDAVALVDPPNRDSFTDGLPRRLTYAEADRVVSALAGRLLGFGLPADSIVAVQLPNTVESVLVLLGVMRAGMIAAPIPLLWRQAEITSALGRVGARVLIAPRRVGTVDYGDIAMHAAAATFAIRFVCGFGGPLPDGIIPLDDIFDPEAEPAPSLPRRDDPADHVAIVTFDIGPDGIIPVARSHAELVAVGAAVVSEVGTSPCAVMINTLATSSLAGLAAVIMPWLLTDGKLVLHHAFAPHVFAAQCAAEHATLATAPGPLLPMLAEAQLVGAALGPSAVLGVWRAPERVAASPIWSTPGASLVDLCAFGEIGLTVARRPEDGNPVVPAVRVAENLRRANSGLLGVEARRTASGTLALRGAMIPQHAFPPRTQRGDPLGLQIDEGGFVDTLYPCQLDRDAGCLAVTGPPAGIVSVGGYRFSVRELQQIVAEIDQEGSVAVLPDALSGHRLAGLAADREAMRQALTSLGINPLLATAFRERRSVDNASAA